MAWTSLCTLDELSEGEGKYVEIDGFRLAVFLDDGTPRVIDNECPHAGGSMSGGWVENGCAVCPWHGWSFNLASGALAGGPTDDPMIRTYPVRTIDHEGERLVQAELKVVDA